MLKDEKPRDHYVRRRMTPATKLNRLRTLYQCADDSQEFSLLRTLAGNQLRKMASDFDFNISVDDRLV